MAVTDRLGGEARKAVRKELRAAAEPIREKAQQLYDSEIGPDDNGRVHARYGVSVRKTGVVTVEQRIKSKNPRNSSYKRPKFNKLQWDEALDPAAAEADLGRAMDNTYERLRAQWIRGF